MILIYSIKTCFFALSQTAEVPLNFDPIREEDISGIKHLSSPHYIKRLWAFDLFDVLRPRY